MRRDWVLITGASEGLGREFARIAAREGHPLILTARQETKLEALAQDLRRAHGTEVVVIPADLSVAAEADRLWTAAEGVGRIGILVNNAGLGSNDPFATADFRREAASVAVNVVAATVLMKRAVLSMGQAGGGRILNVSSTAGFMPGPQMAVYHATKAYLLSLSEAVAEELRGSAVTVTALCPGATKTNFAHDAGMEDIPLFTWTRPADAGAVAEAGWRGMKRGRRILVTGWLNKVFAFGPRFAPRTLVTWIAQFVLGKPDR
jgi:short-subunit dehydrogenase